MIDNKPPLIDIKPFFVTIGQREVRGEKGEAKGVN